MTESRLPRTSLVETAPFASWDSDRPKNFPFIETANLLLRNWKLVLGVIALTFALAVVPAILTARSYTSSGAFLAQSKESASGVQAIAAQFGVGVSSGGMSPQFYVDLLRSREFQRQLVMTQYVASTSEGPRRGTLSDFLDISAKKRPTERLQATIDKLGGLLRASASPSTDVVSFSITTPHADLSQQVAVRVMDLVNKFDVEKRQTHAAAERRFTEKRLAEAREELRVAQTNLAGFRERNRLFAVSPTLEQVNARLAVEMRQREQTYLMLSEAYEKAKIDEVRDTPVLTTIEPPVVPVRPNGRGVVWRGMLGLVIGFLLGGLLAFIRDPLRRAAVRDSADVREFLMLTSGMRNEVKAALHRARLLIPIRARSR
jgi:uncharacterized protein involved in exopolysaccharide biosynthesis